MQGAVVLWCEFTLFLCGAISRRHAPITLLSKFQASVNLSLRALLLIVAVRLRVVRVDTFLAVSLFTSHLRHLRTGQVAMSGGEPVSSWAP